VLRLDEVRKWFAQRKAALNHHAYGDDGHLKLETSERIASILRAYKLCLPGTRYKVEGQRFRVVANFPMPILCPTHHGGRQQRSRSYAGIWVTTFD
jgi:hypothetical protein